MTITLQLGLTRWLLVRYGVRPALLIQALTILVGFVLLVFTPFPLLIAIVQVVTRAGEFGLGKPARESIYTRVDREIRYKAKNVIDTVVYRGGDLTFVWVYKGLSLLQASSNVVFAVGVGAAAIFLGGILWLLRLLPGRDEAIARGQGRT